MTKYATFVSVALLASSANPDEPPRKPVRVYTNEDLDRVHRDRDETGVASVPAAAPPSGATDPHPRTRSGAHPHGEAYWRAEAARVRARVDALDAQAEALRLQIAAAAEPWSTRRRRPAESTRASEARLAAIEERGRRLEADLLDRARREGALPGWLR
jgi:hypothetical protein